MSNWQERARAVIDATIAANPNASPDELFKLVNAAYPFGERRYHPYKVWLKEMRALQLRLTPDESPMKRPCGACGAAKGQPCRKFLSPRAAGEDPTWPIGSPRPMLDDGQFHEARTQPSSGALFSPRPTASEGE